MLYIGYVGLSVSFSFAVAALITGEINKEKSDIIKLYVKIKKDKKINKKFIKEPF